MTKRNKHPKMNSGYREGLLSAVPDDLPDGAYFAMCEELLDMDAGDIFAADDFEPLKTKKAPKKKKKVKG